MPSIVQILAFAADCERTLVSNVADYFTRVRAADRITGLGADLRKRVAIATAQRTLMDEMIQDLERLMAEAAFIGSNGYPLSDAQVSTLRLAFETQAAYMRAFIGKIATLTEPVASARAASYSSAIVQLISKVAAVGLPSLTPLPGDKGLACKGFCKCYLEIPKLEGNGNYDVYWRLGDAKHCPDCERLAATWNPLHIRGGLIQQPKQLSDDELQEVKVFSQIIYLDLWERATTAQYGAFVEYLDGGAV